MSIADSYTSSTESQSIESSQRNSSSKRELCKRIGDSLPSTITEHVDYCVETLVSSQCSIACHLFPDVAAPERIAEYRERVAAGQNIFQIGDRVVRGRPVFQDHSQRLIERDGCTFDELMNHRYLRVHERDRAEHPQILFVDIDHREHSTLKAIAWSSLRGYHRVVIANIYSTLIDGPIADIPDHIGQMNDRLIIQAVASSTLVVAAWGTAHAFDQEDELDHVLHAPLAKDM